MSTTEILILLFIVLIVAVILFNFGPMIMAMFMRVKSGGNETLTDNIADIDTCPCECGNMCKPGQKCACGRDCTCACRGGTDHPQTLSEQVELIARKFTTDRLTPEFAAEMETIADDIAYDIADVVKSKAKMHIDAMYKLLLDTMINYFIHTKTHSTLSRDLCMGNIKLLRNVTIPNIDTSQVINMIEAGLADKSEDVKAKYLSVREYYRRDGVRNSGEKTDSSELESLRAELTRKNRELRERVTPNPNQLWLDECNQERRRIQERMYELKRELENCLHTRSMPDPSHNARIEALVRENDALRTKIATESSQIQNMYTELTNCRQLLNEVLNAQTA